MNEDMLKTSEETVWVEEAEEKPAPAAPAVVEEEPAPKPQAPASGSGTGRTTAAPSNPEGPAKGESLFARNRTWWILQGVFLLVMVVIFNTMWTQMETRIEKVRQGIETYEKGLGELSKSVADLQREVANGQGQGSRQDGAIRRGIESQRFAVQEMIRVLEVQRALLQSQEGILNGEMTPETPIALPADATASPDQAPQ